MERVHLMQGVSRFHEALLLFWSEFLHEPLKNIDTTIYSPTKLDKSLKLGQLQANLLGSRSIAIFTPPSSPGHRGGVQGAKIQNNVEVNIKINKFFSILSCFLHYCADY